MRLVFLGSPPDAVPALRALHDRGHEIALVVTQPDRRRQRGTALVPTPVKVAAEELGVPVRTPHRSREIIDDVAATGAELGVVVAFGQLLPPALLAAVHLGFVNVHFSLLPRWRGAAPVERAILAGDRETGVCLMQIEEGLDTGPVYACERTTIGEQETAGELRERLSGVGTRLLIEVVPRLPDITPEPQRGEPTYAEKLAPEEFRLDPHRPADELARLVRAGNPHPGAWMRVDGRRVKVLRARAEDTKHAPGQLLWPGKLATVDGSLRLEEVQVEGRRPISAEAWMNGLRTRHLTVDDA